MNTRIALLLAAAALAGCGGTDTTGASGADVVPATATAYAEIDADLGSDQWQQVQSLLDRFPSRPKLVDVLNDELRDEDLDYDSDVEPALGDVVVVASFGKRAEDAVVLTQPDDDAKWRALAERSAEGDDVVFGEVGGWQAAAESQAALDKLRAGGAAIGDDDAFTAALDELPDDRLATVWARGTLLAGAIPLAGLRQLGSADSVKLDWVAAAVDVRDEGAGVTLAARGQSVEPVDAYDSQRVDEAPADALAFVSFTPESYSKQTADLPAPVRELFAELEGESAVWVRPGLGTIEVTAVLGAKNAQRAKSAADRLLRQAPVLPLALHTGVVDGNLVVTTARSVSAAVRKPDESLGDSDDLKAAREASGMPEETGGFVFVNVADALPLLSLAGLAGITVPEEALEYARPIRSIVAWNDPSDEGGRFELFVHIE